MFIWYNWFSLKNFFSITSPKNDNESSYEMSATPIANSEAVTGEAVIVEYLKASFFFPLNILNILVNCWAWVHHQNGMRFVLISCYVQSFFFQITSIFSAKLTRCLIFLKWKSVTEEKDVSADRVSAVGSRHFNPNVVCRESSKPSKLWRLCKLEFDRIWMCRSNRWFFVVATKKKKSRLLQGDKNAEITYYKICNAIDLIGGWESRYVVNFLENFINLGYLLDHRCSLLVQKFVVREFIFAWMLL